jgi:hypothetical protein
MKKKSLIIGLLFIAVAVGILTLVLNKTKDKGSGINSNTSSVYADAPSDSCNCEASWFPHDQTPAPEEGDGSPFDTNSTTNCIFHQWSWQKFLWLTKPLPSTRPLFLDSLNLVSSEMEPVAPQLGLSLVLSSINQAGSEGVLQSNPKFNASNNAAKTVYYSIHVNNTLMDRAIMMARLLHSGQIPYQNLETFPVGALELKVSWIDTSAIPETERSSYFTINAAVQNNKGVYESKTVALLGMHVVGVVKNHPEFIWATFEHKDMAPIYDWKNNSARSANEMLFYEKGATTGLTGITWGTNSPQLPNKAFTLFEFGVPRVLGTDSFMQTSQSEPINYANIKHINQCVASNLKDVFKNYFYNGSIWLNTDGVSPIDQAKAIVNNNISSALPDSLARGSVNLANVTMETYTQTFVSDVHSINASTLINCFSCHQSKNFDTSLPGNRTSPLYLSHTFESYLYATKGTPKDAKVRANLKSTRTDEIRALKLNEFRKLLRSKKQ